MKGKWKISIDDGYVEYSYAIDIEDAESINSVYEKIRELFGARRRKGVRREYAAALEVALKDAENKQKIDQRQCDDMTSEAGKMAMQIAALTTRAEKAEQALGELGY